MPKELEPIKVTHRFWTIFETEHVRGCIAQNLLWALKLSPYDHRSVPCDDEQHNMCCMAGRCLRVTKTMMVPDGDVRALRECHELEIQQFCFLKEIPKDVTQASL